jgi:hypothetical protein
MEELTDKKRFKMRLEFLQREFSSNWKPHYSDIVDYILPRRGRFLETDIKPNDGSIKHAITLLDDTAEWANGVLASGMHGGLTSPTRPWFKIGLEDKDLMDYGPIKVWLEKVRDLMMRVFHKSNFYPSVHFQYSELGGFGTSAMLLEPDFEHVIRCYPFSAGEYYIAQNHQLVVDTFYRIMWMTARNVVRFFGKNNVSERVLSMVKHGQGDEWLQVVHLIEPNNERDPDKVDNQNMPFRSVYYEYKSSEDDLLRKSGYETFPVMVPRWEAVGSNVYGDSPGMKALGNSKMLQRMQEKGLKALDKMIDPPMNAPPSMKSTGGGTIVSGGVNYVDVKQGSQGFVPVYQVQPDFQNMEFKIERVQKAIERAYFVDLFLLLSSNDQSREMTATEVAKKHEEKLQVLGPVIERVQNELLDRTIDRTYDIMFKAGMIPPPPPELEGQGFEVEYISILAQAQKMVGTTAVEQTVAFVGQMAEVKPEVLDKLDTDEVVDAYANMTGVPPKMIRSDDQVAEIRNARAEAEQQAADMEQQERMAAGAKTLSETDLDGNNALKALLGGMA